MLCMSARMWKQKDFTFCCNWGLKTSWSYCCCFWTSQFSHCQHFWKLHKTHIWQSHNSSSFLICEWFHQKWCIWYHVSIKPWLLTNSTCKLLHVFSVLCIHQSFLLTPRQCPWIRHEGNVAWNNAMCHACYFLDGACGQRPEKFHTPGQIFGELLCNSLEFLDVHLPGSNPSPIFALIIH